MSYRYYTYFWPFTLAIFCYFLLAEHVFKAGVIVPLYGYPVNAYSLIAACIVLAIGMYIESRRTDDDVVPVDPFL